MDIYESEENFSGSFYIEKFKDKILIFQMEICITEEST